MTSLLFVCTLTTAILWFARGISPSFGYGVASGILYGVALMFLMKDKPALTDRGQGEGSDDAT